MIKKLIHIIFILFLIFNLCSCSTMSILPKYREKECYYSKDFQDHTDFCKYYYSNKSKKIFSDNKNFKVVESNDLERIKEYFLDFEEYIKVQDFYDKYDFDCNSQIKLNDYFYIYTKEGQCIGDSTYGKYDYYDVYYFDTENSALYFIHSNK